jgi:hypothetical protein
MFDNEHHPGCVDSDSSRHSMDDAAAPSRRNARRGIHACIGALLLASFLHAEVIDRIVAVVDGHIFTLSDLRSEREMRARLGEPPIHQNPELAKELVDRYLIEQQIGDYPNVDVSEEEIEADLQGAGSRANDPPGLRDAVRKRIRIQKFLDLKFAESIRPTDQQIRTYYDEVFVPAARARGLNDVPPLSDGELSRAVRDNVIQEALDREVTLWVAALRQRSNIEVFE